MALCLGRSRNLNPTGFYLQTLSDSINQKYQLSGTEQRHSPHSENSAWYREKGKCLEYVILYFMANVL